MSDSQDKKVARRGKRSPGYPMISLEEAVQRAKILWDKDKNNPIPIAAVYEHLGYKTIGGYGGRVLAALKQFGLIYEKQGDIILTNEAVDLALHEPNTDTYIETIGKLALKPTIYERIFNEYKDGLPSDATLKVKLIKDYEFNPDKVNGFLSDFRKTIEFANLDHIESGEQNTTPTGDEKIMENRTTIRTKFPIPPATTPISTLQGEREIANYPIGPGLKARILVSGASFVTSDTINKLINLLELNKNDLPEVSDFNLKDKDETS